MWLQPSRFPRSPFPPGNDPGNNPGNGPSSPTATGQGSAAEDFWGSASETDLRDAWRRLRTELHSALGNADSIVSMVETVGTGILDSASLQVGFVSIDDAFLSDWGGAGVKCERRRVLFMVSYIYTYNIVLLSVCKYVCRLLTKAIDLVI